MAMVTLAPGASAGVVTVEKAGLKFIAAILLQ
jgi:hypothetical protein